MTSATTTKEKPPVRIVGQEEFEAGLGELMRPLVYISLDKIRLRDNPREDSPEAASQTMTASARRMGLLQTVLVLECPEDYELIAGKRRYLASKEAGRSHLPAMVITADEDVDEAMLIAMAVIENTVRLDLRPLEEAKQLALLISKLGFSLEGAAEHLHMSDDLARQRLALLKLPDGVTGRIATGELSLRTAATLSPIAEKAPAVAVALAERVASGAQAAAALDSDPAAALRRLGDEERLPDGVFLVPFSAHDSVNLDEVMQRIRAVAGSDLVPEASRKDVENALVAVAAALEDVPKELRTAVVGEADVDRARAFGVLIEYTEGAFRRPGVLIDPVFAADWAKDAALALNDDPDDDADEDAEAGAGGSEEAEDPAGAKKRRDAAAAAASGANARIDRELAHRFDHQKEVPLDQAVVLCVLMLEAYGRDLAIGHRVVRETWLKREVRPARGGPRTITEFPSIDEIAGLLEIDLRSATTGAAMIGRLFSAVASAIFSDQSVLGSKARPNLELPYGLGREEQLQGLAPAALWRQAEACLTPERADQLRPRFLGSEEEAGPSRDRLARSEGAVSEVLELTPESAEAPAETTAADGELEPAGAADVS